MFLKSPQITAFHRLSLLLTLAASLLAQGPPRGTSGGAVTSAPPVSSAPAPSYSAGSGASIGGSSIGATTPGRSMSTTTSGTRVISAAPVVSTSGAPMRSVPANVGTLKERKAGVSVYLPPALPRWSPRVEPTPEMWRRRDIRAEIIANSRSGYVPVKPLLYEVELEDYVWLPAGWMGYGIVVPVGGQVTVTLQHPKPAWLRLIAMNRWAQTEEGMPNYLQNFFRPTVTYKNPFPEARPLYLVVDDPAWWSFVNSPFTLVIQRNWDPRQGSPEALQLVDGIWAVHTPDRPPTRLVEFLSPPSNRALQTSAARR